MGVSGGTADGVGYTLQAYFMMGGPSVARLLRGSRSHKGTEEIDVLTLVCGREFYLKITLRLFET